MKLAALILVWLFSCYVTPTSAQEQLRSGVWGGSGIELTVIEGEARIDYGCDSGTIDHPLRKDSRGKFFGRGTHVFGSGGPRSPGAPPPRSHRAQYEAVLDGNVLRLNVLLPELNRKLGEFILRLGERPRLERCG